MTFLEALYGSQYYEIQQKGKDGNKGRLNANLFLSAMLVLVVIAVIFLATKFSPAFNEKMSHSVKNIFGEMSGKAVGKILAIPLFIIFYFIISNSIGNKNNFSGKVEAFMQYDNEVKKKANVKILVPFFVLLMIVFGLAVFG